MSFSAAIEAVRGSENDGYFLDFTHSVVISLPIVDELSNDLEYTGSADLGNDDAYRACGSLLSMGRHAHAAASAARLDSEGQL